MRRLQPKGRRGTGDRPYFCASNEVVENLRRNAVNLEETETAAIGQTLATETLVE